MAFFDIFKTKKTPQLTNSQSNLEEPSIFYHEDDFRQIEMIPNDNLEELEIKPIHLKGFSKENLHGAGYSAIYVRNDGSKTELKQRLISPKDLEQVLKTLGFYRIANVQTGYGETARELHPNCIAFGKDYSAIYYDFKGEVVQNIWLTNHWSMEREKLSNCLHEIGKQWNLLLQDWNLAVAIDLNNKQAIDHYLGIYDEKDKRSEPQN